MFELLSRIRKDAERKGITQANLAKNMNVTGGAVNQYFTEKTRIGFIAFVLMVKTVYNDEPTKINSSIFEFIEKNTRPDALRVALEWCSNNGEIDLKKYIISKEKESDSSKGFTYIYDSLLKRNKNKLTKQKLYAEIQDIKVKKGLQPPEAVAIAEIASLYALLDLGGHNVILNLLDETKDIVNLVKEKYLRSSYELRIHELEAVVRMRNGDVENAKRIINKVFKVYNEEDFPIVFNSLYALMASMLMEKDFKESIKLINKSMQMLKEEKFKIYRKRIKEYRSTYDCIKIYNNDLNDLFLESPAELAYYHAKKGSDLDKEKSLAILRDLELTQGKLTPFQLYVYSIVSGDESMKVYAINELRKIGDHFYADVFSRK